MIKSQPHLAMPDARVSAGSTNYFHGTPCASTSCSREFNPTQDVDGFIRLSETTCNKHPREVQFSWNTVVLEITRVDADVTLHERCIPVHGFSLNSWKMILRINQHLALPVTLTARLANDRYSLPYLDLKFIVRCSDKT